MEKRWILKTDQHPEKTAALAKAINVSEVIARILVNRGVDDYDKAYAFFRPKPEDLHDPMTMKGMDVAVNRILAAVNAGENILIYGDYDVDGTTSVALVYSFFRDELRYAEIAYYIPDRYREGYGISTAGVDFAADNNFSLVIALDCGIKAVDKMKYAREKGVDFIICDHHLPGETLPDAVAILNPKQKDCSYPYKELCGCGVGFKLIQALAARAGIGFPALLGYLDLVAIATCSDIVPVTGENRVLVHAGLQCLNNNPRPGIRKIIASVDTRRALTVEDVVFLIGPRINAAGRIRHGSGAVALLIAEENDPLLDEMNRALMDNNRDRKGLDADTTAEALLLIDTMEDYAQRKTTVVFKETWHKGVVGIVASRLTEKHYRPTVVLTQSDGLITGSARSVRDFDVHRAIECCSDLLETFGGHMYAAGLTMRPENLPEFSRRFDAAVAAVISEDLLVPKLEIDAEISFRNITPNFFKVLRQMAPMGPGNMKPLFMTRNVISGPWTKRVGEHHLKLEIWQQEDPHTAFSGIAFKQGEQFEAVTSGKPFSIVYTIDENVWNGITSLQLEVKEIRFHEK